MKNLDQLYFELIRVAIGTQDKLERPPSADEWNALLYIALKQSLVGICFSGIQSLTINHPSSIIHLNESLRLKWMGISAKIQQRNEVVNSQCVEIQQMIEKTGFRTFIMKGQGNAALYNDDLKLLRQSGDIDIFLDGGFDKVNAFVQLSSPTKEINELEIHYHYIEGTEVEIHYRPFILRNPKKNARLQRFFKETMTFENKLALPNNAGSINVPTHEFNLVHQMVHIAHHLFTDGIGLRQVTDYYFVLRSAYKAHNANVLGIVHDIGLGCFASALMWVLGYVFDLPKEYMLWEPCESDGIMLLDEIMKSGNFGHQDKTKFDLRNKWKSFWYVNNKAIRFWKFDHWAWFWSPIWRVYHFAWRKIKGYK